MKLFFRCIRGDLQKKTADMTPDSWSNALTVMETLLVQICVK